MYLSKATNEDIFLFMAADIFDAIESCCKTSCGYTSVKKNKFQKKNEKIFFVFS
jgi:hypothetical protein